MRERVACIKQISLRYNNVVGLTPFTPVYYISHMHAASGSFPWSTGCLQFFESLRCTKNRGHLFPLNSYMFYMFFLVSKGSEGHSIIGVYTSNTGV